jgi:two-component system sensor histidine kinase KdpD
VLVVAVRYGRGPAVLAAFLSVAAFDFFYVPPRFTFAVNDLQYVVTFGVMLVVALVIGQLTAGLKYQAKVATLREDRVRALYEMSRDLSAALMPEQVVEIGTRFLQAEFDARAAFLLTDAEDRLTAPPPGIDHGVAQWAYEHGEAAGYGTDTLPGSPMLYVPLKAPMRVRGVLALEPKNPGRLIVPEQRRLLDTFASLLAIAIERIHYVDVAQGTTVQMESERLRNSLLAAISHDLRTPLASLVGLADSLSLTPPPLAPRHAEIGRSIKDAAQRMNSLVSNLLDMARLESGKVSLNRQWQPLEEVVGSALQAMKPVLVGRHPLKTQLAADLPMVHIDAVLIERVLCNLLENAAKYTPDGTPITIGAAAASDCISVWVDDAGPGLPKGREETIFEKFERGRKESATPGVGLGLAICRAIVEAHGGAIHGETRAGGGARFTFTIPRGEPPGLDGIDDVFEVAE